PAPKPTLIEAIRFRMEQKNLLEADLSEILEHRTRKSEILSGKGTLSLNMIRRLRNKLQIPADVLIEPY
ncbi:MAG: transcriptional regulator, partial [Chitinophagaceae bacterium]|nr:transcriptional regulator [Chitinophagaceae bacterium]